ncbi:MAG: redoxin family protein, partial [Xanthomonadales bacterium]|nr:TlpA family protein disulfide reductase [Xanthomonadales bacterium]NIX12181.1 redoxin family protein [Xanthomonadales bacterium]
MVQSRWMRRRSGGLIRFLAVLSLVVAAGVTAPAAGQPRIDSDRLAFRLQDLDGNLVSAEDPAFEGKVLLVDIWGTWCPPCISSIPVFSRLQEEWGGQGL